MMGIALLKHNMLALDFPSLVWKSLVSRKNCLKRDTETKQRQRKKDREKQNNYINKREK